VIETSELAIKEYEMLQCEKNGRIQARLQVWSVFLALVGAFFIAGLQSGQVSWAILIYPVAAAFLAQFAGHNEAIIDRIKAYLHQFEEDHGYAGYEHYNSGILRRSGSQVKALTGALVTTQVAALAIGITHLFQIHEPWFATCALFAGLYTISNVVVSLNSKS
jgi:drug/metabolite transporter (DMT)-like permease